MTSRVAIHNILLQASTMADGEIKEKIENALKALTASADWDGGFTTGYFVSWAEGLVKQQCLGTPLCDLLEGLIGRPVIQTIVS